MTDTEVTEQESRQQSPDVIVGALGEYRRFDEYVRAEGTAPPKATKGGWREAVEHRWGGFVIESIPMVRILCPVCGDVFSHGDYDENTYFADYDLDSAVESNDDGECGTCGWVLPEVAAQRAGDDS